MSHTVDIIGLLNRDTLEIIFHTDLYWKSKLRDKNIKLYYSCLKLRLPTTHPKSWLVIQYSSILNSRLTYISIE